MSCIKAFLEDISELLGIDPGDWEDERTFERIQREEERLADHAQHVMIDIDAPVDLLKGGLIGIVQTQHGTGGLYLLPGSRVAAAPYQLGGWFEVKEGLD